MQAEIIANGDEITSGKILDTNTRWLCLQLAAFGISTPFHTTVGDNLADMVSALKVASERVSLIIWTGGLGPTADDLTRQAIADFAKVPLEKNEQSLQEIQAIFKRRGYAMPDANNVQAFQPKGAKPIHNPHGTAPGVDFTCERQYGRGYSPEDVKILAYPGVPAELKEMWKDSGEKTIQEWLNAVSGQKRMIQFRSINSFGWGESKVEAALPDIVNRKHFPKVGITATGGTITLRISAVGTTEAECFQTMEPTAKLIYNTLGDLIFSEGEDTMPDVVCRQLNKKSKKIAVIEAGTRGLLAEALAHSDESAGCFAGGIVLPPKRGIFLAEMIRRGWQLFDVDYFLLVGAYPQEKPDRNRKDEVFVAVVEGRKSPTEPKIIAEAKYPFVGHPDLIDDLFIKRVLNLLRNKVSGRQ